MGRTAKFTPEERAQSCRDKNTKYRQSEHGKAVRAQGHATDKRGRRKVAKGHLTRVPPLPSGIEEWTRASLHPEHPIHISARADTEDFDASSIYHFLAPPPFDIPESEREAARTPQPYHRGGTVWLRQRALDGCLERERVKKQEFWGVQASVLNICSLHDEIRAEIAIQLGEWERILSLNKGLVDRSLECAMWQRHVIWKARYIQDLFYLRVLPAIVV
ncbi:hypothetical protein GGX14DRAFT_560439 [Mycena pura]|uniref:Uncharacterized protein n=1 Tax=Mycena pura TaxID=153505 RepID=A0AAD6YJL9_9AGAR|nr:hypothetical protein GGX14DRAFT_560439 [Mycena pura]